MHPPKWADRILEWYCNPDLLEDLQGDLYEVYATTRRTKGKKVADLTYAWLVMRSFRWSAIQKPKRLKNSVFSMTTNNFKIAFRVLARNRTNTAINLAGLTIGIACFLLLTLYVTQEQSYDKFHAKRDRIYRSWLKEDYGEGKVFFSSNTPLRFEEFFEQNFPEVETAVQFIPRSFLVGRGANRLEEQVAVISPEFFEVFDFDIVSGNKGKILPDVRSVIVSESYARKYFGDEDPMGKPLGLQVEQEIEDFIVTGIFSDIPENSSVRFDLAVSNENNRRFFGEGAQRAWFSIIAETYVLLKGNAALENVEAKMQDVVMEYLPGEIKRGQYNIGFQPLTDIHLNPDIPGGYAPVGNPQYVYILGAIGIMVLVIACINYTTLSIGQSLKRAREVGIRKVMGAKQDSLVFQYLSESLLVALIAMSAGTFAALMLIPAFNLLTGTSIFYSFEWWHISVYLAAGLVIGLLAGVYPAFVISGYRIIAILRGNSAGATKHTARKGMLVFQFLITIFLISTTLIIRQQVSFMQNKHLGYEYKEAVAVAMQADPAAQRLPDRVASGFENGKLLKAALEKHPEIGSIGMGTHVFGTDGWASLAFTDESNVFRRFNLLIVDEQYLKTFEIKIKEGRDFEPGNGLDQRQSVILNEAAVRYFGLQNPIGAKLPGRGFGEHRIIGITEDFNFTSLHTAVEPLVIVQNPLPIFEGISDWNVRDSMIPKLVFTYTGSSLTGVEEILSAEWEQIFPNEAVDFGFIDQDIQMQYENEARLNRMLAVATVISIVIAVLGLVGLTVLVVNSRIREIGIRKVMGATPLILFGMLSRSFLMQLGLAVALAVPLTVLLMNQWLNNFAYHISIGIGVFLVSALAALLIAFAVIFYHTLRASRINPVESLRME